MAEKEYIEREAVIELAKSNKAVCSCLADIVDVKEIVNDVPTADVKPVVHAKWIEREPYSDESQYGFEFSIVCSHCDNPNAYPQFENGILKAWTFDRTNYCPNCGARMDGGENNEKT